METLNTHDKPELESSKKLARASLKRIYTDLKDHIDDRHNEIIEVYSGKEQKIPIDTAEKQISDYAKLVVKLEEIAESLDLKTLPTIDGSNYYLLDLEKGGGVIISKKQTEGSRVYIADKLVFKTDGTVNTEYLQLRPFNKDGQIAPLDYTKIARLCNNRINYHLNNPKGVIAVAFLIKIEETSNTIVEIAKK